MKLLKIISCKYKNIEPKSTSYVQGLWSLTRTLTRILGISSTLITPVLADTHRYRDTESASSIETLLPYLTGFVGMASSSYIYSQNNRYTTSSVIKKNVIGWTPFAASLSLKMISWIRTQDEDLNIHKLAKPGYLRGSSENPYNNFESIFPHETIRPTIHTFPSIPVPNERDIEYQRVIGTVTEEELVKEFWVTFSPEIAADSNFDGGSQDFTFLRYIYSGLTPEDLGLLSLAYKQLQLSYLDSKESWEDFHKYLLDELDRGYSRFLEFNQVRFSHPAYMGDDQSKVFSATIIFNSQTMTQTLLEVLNLDDSKRSEALLVSREINTFFLKHGATFIDNDTVSFKNDRKLETKLLTMISEIQTSNKVSSEFRTQLYGNHKWRVFINSFFIRRNHLFTAMGRFDPKQMALLWALEMNMDLKMVSKTHHFKGSADLLIKKFVKMGAVKQSDGSIKFYDFYGLKQRLIQEHTSIVSDLPNPQLRDYLSNKDHWNSFISYYLPHDAFDQMFSTMIKQQQQQTESDFSFYPGGLSSTTGSHAIMYISHGNGRYLGIANSGLNYGNNDTEPINYKNGIPQIPVIRVLDSSKDTETLTVKAQFYNALVPRIFTGPNTIRDVYEGFNKIAVQGFEDYNLRVMGYSQQGGTCWERAPFLSLSYVTGFSNVTDMLLLFGYEHMVKQMFEFRGTLPIDVFHGVLERISSLSGSLFDLGHIPPSRLNTTLNLLDLVHKKTMSYDPLAGAPPIVLTDDGLVHQGIDSHAIVMSYRAPQYRFPKLIGANVRELDKLPLRREFFNWFSNSSAVINASDFIDITTSGINNIGIEYHLQLHTKKSVKDIHSDSEFFLEGLKAHPNYDQLRLIPQLRSLSQPSSGWGNDTAIGYFNEMTHFISRLNNHNFEVLNPRDIDKFVIPNLMSILKMHSHSLRIMEKNALFDKPRCIDSIKISLLKGWVWMDAALRQSPMFKELFQDVSFDLSGQSGKSLSETNVIGLEHYSEYQAILNYQRTNQGQKKGYPFNVHIQTNTLNDVVTIDFSDSDDVTFSKTLKHILPDLGYAMEKSELRKLELLVNILTQFLVVQRFIEDERISVYPRFDVQEFTVKHNGVFEINLGIPYTEKSELGTQQERPEVITRNAIISQLNSRKVDDFENSALLSESPILIGRTHLNKRSKRHLFALFNKRSAGFLVHLQKLIRESVDIFRNHHVVELFPLLMGNPIQHTEGEKIPRIVDELRREPKIVYSYIQTVKNQLNKESYDVDLDLWMAHVTVFKQLFYASHHVNDMGVKTELKKLGTFMLNKLSQHPFSPDVKTYKHAVIVQLHLYSFLEKDNDFQKAFSNYLYISPVIQSFPYNPSSYSDYFWKKFSLSIEMFNSKLSTTDYHFINTLTQGNRIKVDQLLEFDNTLHSLFHFGYTSPKIPCPWPWLFNWDTKTFIINNVDNLDLIRSYERGDCDSSSTTHSKHIQDFLRSAGEMSELDTIREFINAIGLYKSNENSDITVQKVYETVNHVLKGFESRHVLKGFESTSVFLVDLIKSIANYESKIISSISYLLKHRNLLEMDFNRIVNFLIFSINVHGADDSLTHSILLTDAVLTQSVLLTRYASLEEKVFKFNGKSVWQIYRPMQYSPTKTEFNIGLSHTIKNSVDDALQDLITIAQERGVDSAVKMLYEYSIADPETRDANCLEIDTDTAHFECNGMAVIKRVNPIDNMVVEIYTYHGQSYQSYFVSKTWVQTHLLKDAFDIETMDTDNFVMFQDKDTDETLHLLGYTTHSLEPHLEIAISKSNLSVFKLNKQRERMAEVLIPHYAPYLSSVLGESDFHLFNNYEFKLIREITNGKYSNTVSMVSDKLHLSFSKTLNSPSHWESIEFPGYKLVPTKQVSLFRHTPNAPSLLKDKYFVLSNGHDIKVLLPFGNLKLVEGEMHLSSHYFTHIIPFSHQTTLKSNPRPYFSYDYSRKDMSLHSSSTEAMHYLALVYVSTHRFEDACILLDSIETNTPFSPAINEIFHMYLTTYPHSKDQPFNTPHSAAAQLRMVIVSHLSSFFAHEVSNEDHPLLLKQLHVKPDIVLMMNKYINGLGRNQISRACLLTAAQFRTLRHIERLLPQSDTLAKFSLHKIQDLPGVLPHHRIVMNPSRDYEILSDIAPDDFYPYSTQAVINPALSSQENRDAVVQEITDILFMKMHIQHHAQRVRLFRYTRRYHIDDKRLEKLILPYLLSDKKRYHDLSPGLSARSVDKIDILIEDYLKLSLEVKTGTPYPNDELLRFRTVLAMEYLSGFYFTQTQLHLAEQTRNVPFSMVMMAPGEGKSSVMIKESVLNDLRYSMVSICTPNTLSQSMYDDIRDIGQQLGFPVFYLQFQRHLTTSDNGLGFDLGTYKEITDRMTQIKEDKGVITYSSSSYYALKLKLIELTFLRLEGSTHKDIDQGISYLQQMLNIIHQAPVKIDEPDDITDPNFQIKYAISKSEPVPLEYLRAVDRVMQLWFGDSTIQSMIQDTLMSKLGDFESLTNTQDHVYYRLINKQSQTFQKIKSYMVEELLKQLVVDNPFLKQNKDMIAAYMLGGYNDKEKNKALISMIETIRNKTIDLANLLVIYKNIFSFHLEDVLNEKINSKYGLYYSPAAPGFYTPRPRKNGERESDNTVFSSLEKTGMALYCYYYQIGLEYEQFKQTLIDISVRHEQHKNDPDFNLKLKSIGETLSHNGQKRTIYEILTLSRGLPDTMLNELYSVLKCDRSFINLFIEETFFKENRVFLNHIQDYPSMMMSDVSVTGYTATTLYEETIDPRFKFYKSPSLSLPQLAIDESHIAVESISDTSIDGIIRSIKEAMKTGVDAVLDSANLAGLSSEDLVTALVTSIDHTKENQEIVWFYRSKQGRIMCYDPVNNIREHQEQDPDGWVRDMSILTETESRGANFQWIDKMLMFVDINNPRDFQIQALGRARKFMNALKNDVMGGKKSVAEIERLFPVIIKVPESQLNYVRHYLGKTPEETISRKELFQTIEHKSIPILATSLAKQLHRFITEIIRSAALHVLMSPQSSESDQNLAVSAYVSKRSIHPSETEIELPLSAQIITSYEEKYSPLIEKFRAILSPQQLKEIHSRCVKADTYLDFLSQAEIELDKEDGIEEIEQSLTLEDNVYRENTEAILPHIPRPEQSLSCLGSGNTRCLHNIFDDINDLNSTSLILVSQDFKTIAEKSLEYNNRYFRPLEYMAYVEYPSPNNPLQINRHWLGLDYSGLDYLLGDRSTRLPKHTALTLVDNQAHIYIDETNVGPNLIKDVVSLCNAYNSNYVGS